MANPAVVYLIIATSLLFFLSSAPHSGLRQRKGHRLHRHITFDPLVDELERRAQEEASLDAQAFRKKMRSSGGVMKYYFGEEGSLNTTQRLMHLFPLLDQSPKDGFVSFVELDLWNKGQVLDRLMYITDRRMRVYDQNGDSEVTLSEFFSHIPEEERDWNNKEHGKPGWWKDLFISADIDDNGSLNDTEFNDLLHPEDSISPKVQMWFWREKLSEMDPNQDGKLSFEEFRHQTHGIFSDTSDTDIDKDANPKEESPEHKFAELDVNKDKFLTAEELRPIIYHLHPGEFSHATYYTKYLMHKADDDKDGKLTMKEMLDHYNEFYNAVFEEEPNHYYYDDDDHVDDHDDDNDDHHQEELR